MKVKYFIYRYSDGNLRELDAKSVKSPGGLDNVAPDAKAIITPQYAGIFI
jgi:hypothetical protein